MPTAPAVVRSRFKWHTRATWSAREDRIPSLVWLALIWFGMVTGFGVDMPRFLHESPPPAAVVDVLSLCEAEMPELSTKLPIST